MCLSIRYFGSCHLCDTYGQKLKKLTVQCLKIFCSPLYSKMFQKMLILVLWFPLISFFPSYFYPLCRHINIKKRFLFKLLTGKEFWYLHFICFFSFRMCIFLLWSYVTSTKFGVPFSEDWEYQMKVTYIHYTSNFIREWIVIWVNMNNNLLIKQLHQR